MQYVQCIGMLITLEGVVQGVGYRPFVQRLALSCQVMGQVVNQAGHLTINVEGERAAVNRFTHLLQERASEDGLHVTIQKVAPKGFEQFSIENSRERAAEQHAVTELEHYPLDRRLCDDCVQELIDPNNKRFNYPFIGCIQCGPRYGILATVPYDRHHTAFEQFPPCNGCVEEYKDIENRRYHAQNITCSQCGPQLRLLNCDGGLVSSSDDEAIEKTVEALRSGLIVAVKGSTGFQLLVSASNQSAIKRLRQRKRRKTKPFALMMPDIGWTKKCCRLSVAEEKMLRSPEGPIVLIEKRDDEREGVERLGIETPESMYKSVAEEVAPNNPYLGVMLPTTAIHYRIFQLFREPIVATSANRSGNPVCYENEEAIDQLNGIADLYLLHDLAIVNPQDDSVGMVVNGKATLIRRARGYSPTLVDIATPDLPSRRQVQQQVVLARGAHLKNTVAIAVNGKAIVSQFIGDLNSVETVERHQTVVKHLTAQQGVEVTHEVCDRHPDYQSTRLAEKNGIPVTRIQHHYAHACACAVEQGWRDDFFAIVWDGAGYGDDGSIWGGEGFFVESNHYHRVTSLLPFALPGGDKAIKEPRLVGLSLLHQLALDSEKDEFLSLRFVELSDSARELLRQNLQKAVVSPLTTSMGRLLDGISSLLHLVQVNTFEGEAAMALQFAAERYAKEINATAVQTKNKTMGYSFAWEKRDGLWCWDWRPLIVELLQDTDKGCSVEYCAYRVHQTLVDFIVNTAKKNQLDQKSLKNIRRIIVSGGCFQNRLLLQMVEAALKSLNIDCCWPQRFPANDGGVSLGQLAAYFLGNNS